jgi:serine/threonine protein kinase|tara:strand:- start:1217 stop:2227 length:1011 start_codon:yes stop_codon:yes gene_type:complete
MITKSWWSHTGSKSVALDFLLLKAYYLTTYMGAKCFSTPKTQTHKVLEQKTGTKLTPFLQGHYQKHSFFIQHNTVWKVYKSKEIFQNYELIRTLQGGERHLLKPTKNIEIFAGVYAVSMALGSCDLFERLCHSFTYDFIANTLHDIGEAIQWLHARGIAHRDIKPENVIIVDGCAKLADFEFSCRLGDNGILGGTAHYHPEHIMRDTPKHYQRSDVYAYGKTICIVLVRAYKHEYIQDARHMQALFYDTCTRPYHTSVQESPWDSWSQLALQCCQQDTPAAIPQIHAVQNTAPQSVKAEQSLAHMHPPQEIQPVNATERRRRLHTPQTVTDPYLFT